MLSLGSTPTRPSATPRAFVAAAAAACYVGAIVLANWMITHVGVPNDHGTHFAPVGFGLDAPSGVYAAAVAFPARDIVQRAAGRGAGLVAIGIGAAISWFVSTPEVAVASATTFVVSETVDFGVFTLLWRSGLVRAVAVSSSASLLADSYLFVLLLGLPSTAVPGQVLGKTWVVLATLPLVWALRRLRALQFNTTS